jgi:hypothetical protein
MLVDGFFNHKRNKEKQKTQSKVILLGGRTTKDIKEKKETKQSNIVGRRNHKRHKRKTKGTKQNGGCLEYGMP